ncbi:ATP-binding cassette sub-family B member 7, mitochondrial [Nosema bombycis CQ1]|uniref:ATP-binding cassette sub-family B member 7, mitochondrial n=1 Tax=Nosema bombycis (strain CQ1 / CVCC 102059) TaxID=578461 RepID=R0M6S8_NOSB1|nr:ATP-binding cassette sub-family B member 7, mitochondrial [Nosema bombycis CQ1]|eukprot:EOB13709.1 ATP-binding cassette sub-family B member 7, mitochondrial [Nosema bombycis CQ1]
MQVLFIWTSISMMNRFVFSIPVQRVYRLTCKNVFEKCIKLELGAYSHLGSGEIQTVIDRESKAISELVEVSFLNIIPIFFAIILTSYNVMNQLGLVILCIIMFTVALFIVSTIAIVHWRTKIRHDYNLSQQICSQCHYKIL